MRNKLALCCLLIMFFITPKALAQHNASAQVEIFDIKQEQVVKTSPVNPAIQKEAKTYLGNITGIYPKASPIPKEGFMIKIPLEPSVQIQNQWMNEPVDQVIVVAGEKEKPFLLVLDKQNQARLFTFKGAIKELLTLLDYTP